MVRQIPIPLILVFLVEVAVAIGVYLAILRLWMGREAAARRLIAGQALFLAVFFGALTIYLANGKRHLQVDTQPAIFGAMSFVRHGWFDLTPFERNVEPLRDSVLLTGADGLTYTIYPPGSTLACVPFALPIAHLGRLTNLDLDFASKRMGAVTAALSVAFLFAALRRLSLTPAAVWISTIAYAFGTTLFSTASQDAWQHGPAMLGLTIALYGIARTYPHEVRSAWIVGAGLGWACLARPTPLATGALVALYLLARDRRRFLYLLLGALPFGIFWCGYAWRVYGSPLVTGYGVTGKHTFVPGFWRNLWLTFFHESRGIFVYSPFLFAGLAGFAYLIAAIRREAPNDEPLSTVLIYSLSAFPIAAYAAAIGQFWSGWSYGYRTCSECAALLMPPFAIVVDRIWPNRYGKIILILLVAAAIGIHALEWAFPNDIWNAREDLRTTPQILLHLAYARNRLGL